MQAGCLIVEAKGFGIVLRQADSFVITVSELIHRAWVLGRDRVAQECDRFAFVLGYAFAKEIALGHESARAGVTRGSRHFKPLRRLHEIALDPRPVRVTQTYFL